MINSFLSTGWGKKGPVGRSGFFLFFPNLFFYKLECTGEEVNKIKFKT